MKFHHLTYEWIFIFWSDENGNPFETVQTSFLHTMNYTSSSCARRCWIVRYGTAKTNIDINTSDKAGSEQNIHIIWSGFILHKTWNWIRIILEEKLKVITHPTRQTLESEAIHLGVGKPIRDENDRKQKILWLTCTYRRHWLLPEEEEEAEWEREREKLLRACSFASPRESLNP